MAAIKSLTFSKCSCASVKFGEVRKNKTRREANVFCIQENDEWCCL